MFERLKRHTCLFGSTNIYQVTSEECGDLETDETKHLLSESLVCQKKKAIQGPDCVTEQTSGSKILIPTGTEGQDFPEAV